MDELTTQDAAERAAQYAAYHARRLAPIRMEYSDEYSARKGWATHDADDSFSEA